MSFGCAEFEAMTVELARNSGVRSVAYMIASRADGQLCATLKEISCEDFYLKPPTAAVSAIPYLYDAAA
jgi:hypothetical protein